MVDAKQDPCIKERRTPNELMTDIVAANINLQSVYPDFNGAINYDLHMQALKTATLDNIDDDRNSPLELDATLTLMDQEAVDSEAKFDGQETAKTEQTKSQHNSLKDSSSGEWELIDNCENS